MYGLPGCIWPSLTLHFDSRARAPRPRLNTLPSLVVVLRVSALVPACIRLAPERGLPLDS